VTKSNFVNLLEKKMKKTITTLLVALASVSMTSPAQAITPYDIINVSFMDTGYVGKGVIGTDTDVWNNADNTQGQGSTVNKPVNPAKLVSTQSFDTNVQVTYNGNTDTFGAVSSAFGGTLGSQLMNTYTYSDATSFNDVDQIVISGLDTRWPYSVYVLSQANTEATSSLTVRMTGDIVYSPLSTILNDNISANAFAGNQGLNYLMQERIHPDQFGNITIQYVKGAAGGNLGRGVINGVQVQYIPEPASMVLLGIGGFLAARRMKRTKSEHLVA
jgi:hypothetical protein